MDLDMRKRAMLALAAETLASTGHAEAAERSRSLSTEGMEPGQMGELRRETDELRADMERLTASKGTTR